MTVTGDGSPLAVRISEFYAEYTSGYLDSSEPRLWCGRTPPEFGDVHIWVYQHESLVSGWAVADAAVAERSRLGLVAVVVADVPMGYAGRPQYLVVDGRGAQWLPSEREALSFLRHVVGEV